MPLSRRIIKVTFAMPQGQPPLVLDQDLELNVGIQKNCLQVQSTADIEVYNLTTTQRAYMLSNFSEWNARQIQSGLKAQDKYINVTIEAGYDAGKNAAPSVLFNGQVVTTSLTSTPPNLGMKFNCASRQIDKTKDNVGPPNSATFRDYVIWAAGVMGVGYVCQTSFDSSMVKNGFNSISDVSALIMAIQAMYQPHIVAYVDNNTLYVRDVNKPFANESVIPINEFIGVPSMTSYGATFRTLLNTSVHLGGLVDIQSQMNPALAIGKPFVVYKLDYSLSSRQTDFYMNAEVYPEATWLYSCMSGLQNNPILNRQPGQASFGDHLRALLDDHSMRSDKLIPAKVISFDRAQNIATIQPMIMLVDSDSNTRLRNQIAEVPVVSLGGGGFQISFPLKAGDLGWILAADRDISLFMQNLSAARPNTNRKHQFADSWFIPDVFRKYTINGEDDAAMVIQSVDGSTRVSIGDGTVNITAPTSVKIDTPNATFTGNVMIEKNLQVMMMTNVYGGFSAYGFGGGPATCTLPETTTIGGIVVYGHGHIENNTPGGRTSGGMIQ